jgi:hypothetical protein
MLSPTIIGANAIHASETYVLLMNSDCDWEYRDQFDYLMRLNNTQYEQYLEDYQVVCLGGVDNLADVEMYVFPDLRHSVPDAKFIFVYPDSMLQEYYEYVGHKYGNEYMYMALGNTDLPNGVAFAGEIPMHIKHEMAHLDICGTWHDAEGKDLGQIVLHPDADHLSWCS